MLGDIGCVNSCRFLHWTLVRHWSFTAQSLAWLPNGVRRLLLLLFSIRAFFHGYWQLTGQQGNGGDLSTLYVRWLSHIFNCNACIYQTATRWDLPPYRVTVWLIDDVILTLSLFTCWFALRFCYSYLTWKKPVESNSHRLSPLYYKRKRTEAFT